MNLDTQGVLAVMFLLRHHRDRRLPIPAEVAHLERMVKYELRCAATGTGDSDDTAEWISTTEYAARMGCSERHARNLARQSGARKIAGRWIIRWEAP